MKTFIISECGINHNGSLDIAKKMIEESKKSGAHAVKFQTYTVEERVNEKNVLFKEIFDRCFLSYDNQIKLKEFSDSIGIEFFSTPFGLQSLKFLVEDLKLKRVKISSFDLINIDFLNVLNEYGLCNHELKVIMSTGMSNLADVRVAERNMSNMSHLTFLHCVSSYPTPTKNANLKAVKTLLENIKLDKKYISVGLSDHSDNIFIPSLSVLIGAEVIEKHFTLDKNGPYVDNPVSADPKMFKLMVDKISEYEDIMGSGEIKIQEIEIETSKIFRRNSL